MTYGQGEPPPGWDPFKPRSQQRAEQERQAQQPTQAGRPPVNPWATPGTSPAPGDPRGGGTPDWAALAEQTQARNKRRKLFLIGGGVLATLAVGAAVAAAVVSANRHNSPSHGASGLPSSEIPSGTGTPSFAPTSAPPPLDPKDFISSAAKDTAPLDAGTLFPGTTVTLSGAVYHKGATSDTKDCASAVSGSLGKVLTKNRCTRLIRVTYTTAGGVATTVGVALFDSASEATAARKQADTKSIVKALPGKGVKSFCDGPVCRSTTNSFGRYAYFTLAGFPSGKDVTQKDTTVFSAGDDLADFTYQQILQRGQAQASAAAGQ